MPRFSFLLVVSLYLSFGFSRTESAQNFPFDHVFDYSHVSTFAEFIDKAKPCKKDLVVLDVDCTLLMDGEFVADATIIPGLKVLIDHKIPFLLLTARAFGPAHHQELLQDLKLSHQSSLAGVCPYTPIYLGKPGLSPVFLGSVLYVKYQSKPMTDKGELFLIEASKGESLKYFLEKMNMQPERIFFMDDQERFLKQVYKAFKSDPVKLDLFMPPSRGLGSQGVQPMDYTIPALIAGSLIVTMTLRFILGLITGG